MGVDVPQCPKCQEPEDLEVVDEKGGYDDATLYWLCRKCHAEFAIDYQVEYTALCEPIMENDDA